MRTTIFWLFCLFIVSPFASAQNQRINGFVYDKHTNETLIGATIFQTNGGNGTITNKFGYFTLNTEKMDIVTITISFLGYKAEVLQGNLYDTLLHIYLDPAGFEMSEVEVTALKKLEEQAQMSRVSIKMEQIKNLPNIMGAPDILKAYQLMPGINMGNEGNNGLFVRGGTPDQNLFLLDDVPLYNVSHLGGLFSIFDPAMVKKVDLYKGGFPARYGGKIAAVVDIRNKDGNMHKWQGEAGWSILLSNVFIEGPIKEGKSSVALSARRSNIDIYTFLYNRLNSKSFNQGYTFFDLNLKASVRLSDKNRLFFTSYAGSDNVYHFERQNLETSKTKLSSNLGWGNTMAGIRWLHVLNNNIFTNTTFAYSGYRYENSNKNELTFTNDERKVVEKLTVFSGINDLIIKNDTEISLKRVNFNTGFSFTQHFYTPTSLSYESSNENEKDTDNIRNNLQAFEGSVYGEVEYQQNKISSILGMRANTYLVEKTLYPMVEPRFVLNYQFIPRFSIKASYNIMHQTSHLLTNSNTGLPSDIWVPSTSSIKPEKAHQVAAGIVHTTNHEIEISVEAFVRRISGLIDYKNGVMFYSSGMSWDDKIEKGGKGNVKGIELLIKKDNGILTGWAGYSLNFNERLFANLNNGRAFPFTYEQRHNISLVLNYMFSQKFSISSAWQYHTGNNITLPAARYELYDNIYRRTESDQFSTIHLYDKKNGFKMPDYHRLDLAFNFTKKKPNGIAKWSWSVYNVYNRQNAYYLFLKAESNGKIRLYQQSLFPLMVNFGYTFSF